MEIPPFLDVFPILEKVDFQPAMLVREWMNEISKGLPTHKDS